MRASLSSSLLLLLLLVAAASVSLSFAQAHDNDAAADDDDYVVSHSVDSDVALARLRHHGAPADASVSRTALDVELATLQRAEHLVFRLLEQHPDDADIAALDDDELEHYFSHHLPATLVGRVSSMLALATLDGRVVAHRQLVHQALEALVDDAHERRVRAVHGEAAVEYDAHRFRHASSSSSPSAQRLRRVDL